MTFMVRSGKQDFPLWLPRSGAKDWHMDKNVPLVDMKTETQVVSQVLFMDRTFAALSSTFGFLALLLACVGLYGTMAYAVARKTNEIGIRMALGAKRGNHSGHHSPRDCHDRAGWSCRRATSGMGATVSSRPDYSD